MALAPDAPFLPTSGAPFKVPGGARISFRLTLVGSAIRFRERVVRTMSTACAKSLGRGFGLPRGLFELEHVEEIPPVEDACPDAAILDLVTPLRLKVRGRIASGLEVEALVDAVARRAESLAGLYGEPWPGPLDISGIATTLDMHADLHVVPVPRYSSRQGSRMVWPGLVGQARLEGKGLSPLWPLLRFGEAVQIGKNTTFGFGRYLLKPLLS